MSTPFMGEIKIASFNFAPKGWALCNGQLLPINQNQALFSLLGTTYGGDGRVNFALPNLRGDVPIHMGSGHTRGEKGGATNVTINQQTMPTHVHFLQGSSQNGDTAIANNTILAGALNVYGPPSNLTTLDPTSVTNFGGSQAHNNMMPYLVLNFIIALQGIFPSQS
jgi:microcystin-dependent protein